MLRDIIDFSLKAHCSNTIAFGMRRADGTSDARQIQFGMKLIF
jgi:hypothetical protein